MRIDDDRDEALDGPVAALPPTRRGRSGERRQPPTSKDVARVAGVSQSTVSYVLSGRRPISDRTRALVLDAIEQLTYEPHAGARALAGHRTHVIGLVMPFHSPDSAGGLMAFTEQIALSAREHDHDILMLTSQEGPAGLARVGRRAMCDGAIVMEITVEDPRADVARELEMPVIFIGLPEDRTGLHCIDFDFEAGARLLVDELADAGAGAITVLGWEALRERMHFNYVPRFRDSAQARCAERGVELHWHRATPEASGVDAFLDVVLAGPGRPAVLVTQGLYELGVGLQRRGVVPGRDLDLVALCTDAEAQLQHVPTTAVSPQPRDVSRQAMAWLFELLEGEDAPEVRLIDAVISRRESVRAVA